MPTLSHDRLDGMSEQIPDDDDLWVGTCEHCDARYQVFDTNLIAAYPELMLVLDETDDFEANCARCQHHVTLVRQSVKVVPFSAWNVMPATTGCPQCGADHEPDIPHNVQSMVYKYWFRSNEARNGRPERWPTWNDAMAHCTPEIQAQWTQALIKHGVDI